LTNSGFAPCRRQHPLQILQIPGRCGIQNGSSGTSRRPEDFQLSLAFVGVADDDGNLQDEQNCTKKLKTNYIFSFYLLTFY
jgi:hypothetical protein